MSASWVPRPRRPYLDRCPQHPDGGFVPPVTTTAGPTAGTVVADYLCPAGDVWTRGWQRDPDDQDTAR